MATPVRNRFALAQSRANVAGQAVSIEGLDVLQRAMRAAPRELEQAFRRDLKAVAEPIKQAARANVRSGSKNPTGRLESSIEVRTSTRGRRIGVRIGGRLPYIGVREFGRQRTLSIPGRAPAVQTLVPLKAIMRAIEVHRSRVKPQVERIVDHTLDKVFAAAGVTRVG